ncbi:hypothetical protein FRC10_012059, partial [Ceratobasidium sp. 414]
MTLQKVAIIDWNRSEASRKNATITIGGSIRAIEDILPTQRLFERFMSVNAPARKYTYGTFACTWVENNDHSTAYLGASRVACYKSRSPPSGPSRDSVRPPGQAPTPDEGQDTLFAAIEFCAVPRKPKVQITV